MRIHCINIVALLVVATVAGCSPAPVDIRFEEDIYILEGQDATARIVAVPVDKHGNDISSGVDLTFFSPNRNIITVSNDGQIRAVASGEDRVEVDVVGADVKAYVDVRVKISAAVKVSHERLRLWVGQIKRDTSAHVVSEKDAYIEGYLPIWTSDDPTIVSVTAIEDPTPTKFKRSYVEMVGLRSGDTTIHASYQHLTTSIVVRVYAEDDEVDPSGQRIPKEEDESSNPSEEQE